MYGSSGAGQDRGSENDCAEPGSAGSDLQHKTKLAASSAFATVTAMALKIIDIVHRCIVGGLFLGTLGLTQNVLSGGWQIYHMRAAAAAAIAEKEAAKAKK